MKKPPTKSRGIIRTGTKAMTTDASAKIVERKRPKDELIKANNSIDSKDKKKAVAELSKFEGK
jgi:hypothetical protein